MVASTWPAVTASPACTFTAVTVPEDEKLRSSVCAAAIVPSAETVLLMVPRVTVTSCLLVVTVRPVAELPPSERIATHHTPKPTITTSATTATQNEGCRERRASHARPPPASGGVAGTGSSAGSSPVVDSLSGFAPALMYVQAPSRRRGARISAQQRGELCNSGAERPL